MYFPIGDIHGEYDGMRRLYDRIVAEIQGGVDPKSGGTIVFLGDYIDRGKDSKRVLDFCMSLEDSSDIKHIFLKGNHEDFMVNCRRTRGDYVTMDLWQFHGGEDTFKSFGIDVPKFYGGALDEYVEWMEGLPIIAYDDSYVFVHAAIDIYQPLSAQKSEDCMWRFERMENAYEKYDKIVVHGHMIRKFGPIVDIPNNRIWMDNGMYIFKQPASLCLPEPYIPDQDIEILYAF